MQDRLEDVKAQVQTVLDEAMSHLPPGELADAMRYACIGGKRIRAFLVMEFRGLARLHSLMACQYSRCHLPTSLHNACQHQQGYAAQIRLIHISTCRRDRLFQPTQVRGHRQLKPVGNK